MIESKMLLQYWTSYNLFKEILGIRRLQGYWGLSTLNLLR